MKDNKKEYQNLMDKVYPMWLKFTNFDIFGLHQYYEMLIEEKKVNFTLAEKNELIKLAKNKIIENFTIDGNKSEDSQLVSRIKSGYLTSADNRMIINLAKDLAVCSYFQKIKDDGEILVV